MTERLTNLWPAPLAAQPLNATVTVPGSKSLSNRYLILAALGSKVVVLTGIAFGAGKNGVYGLDTTSGEYFAYENDHIDAAYHGTGDVFSSVSVGGIVRGLSYADAFALAADYTADTIRETLKNPDKPWYGVDFEATIPELVKMLAEKLEK